MTQRNPHTYALCNINQLAVQRGGIIFPGP